MKNTKLYKIWQDMQDEGKFLKRNKISVLEFREVARICNSLLHGETDTTICENVKRVFEKYNFGVFCEGIGWRIKKNKQTKKEFENCLISLYGEQFYNAYFKGIKANETN